MSTTGPLIENTRPFFDLHLTSELRAFPLRAGPINSPRWLAYIIDNAKLESKWPPNLQVSLVEAKRLCKTLQSVHAGSALCVKCLQGPYGNRMICPDSLPAIPAG